MNGKILNKEALKAWILSKVVTLTNNLLATTPGVSAMDAAQGPVIQGQIDAINSNFGGCSFGMTEDGQPGYRKPGADTVYPFKAAYKINCSVNYIVKNQYGNEQVSGTSNGYIVVCDSRSIVNGFGKNIGQNLGANAIVVTISVTIKSIEKVNPEEYF